MSFFKPTVDDAISTFTKAESKLHQVIANLQEDLDTQQQIINDATTKRRELTVEVVRASHLADKIAEFLK